MSTKKYWSQSGDSRVDGKILWPGLHGIPLRLQNGQSVPVLERGQIDESTIDHKFFIKSFDMAVEADRREVSEIMEKAIHGWYIVHHHERRWEDGDAYPKVYLEWVQRYTIPPPGA